LPFSLLLFASAGMGATPFADGLSTTAFPSNTGGGSIEVLESTAPLLFTRKEYRTDSGGIGRYRGGLGQLVEVQNLSDTPIRVTLVGDRERHPALGILGGGPGEVAAVTFEDGKRVSLKSSSTLAAGASVLLAFAGGGGYGSARDRDASAIARDIQQGLISPGAANRDYGTRAGASLQAQPKP
jgi:N-methylhydantoinase B